MSLAFDPAKSPHYKVVSVGFKNYRYQIDIYSSETGEWSGADFTAQNIFKSGVYWKGAVHWISDVGADSSSLYFDIDHHVLEKMPNTPISAAGYGRKDYYFGESCGHLHYIQTCESRVQFNVYEMKRDYSEWFVKYRVDLSLVVAANPGMILSYLDGSCRCNYDFSVFSIVRGKEEEDSFLVLRIPGQAIRYNLVPKTSERLHEFEGGEVKDVLRFPCVKGFQYIEYPYSI